MDSGRFLKVPDRPTCETDSDMDKYTASIELSNACRQFYKSRLEAAHCFKSRWEKQSHNSCRSSSNSDNGNSNDNDRPADNRNAIPLSQKRQKNSIDEAMDKLRSEMTSLMDQDLSLMKQLLTLNETIEELKWQRRYYYHHNHHHHSHSRCSLHVSSTDVLHSDLSISDTEMYDSDDDALLTIPQTATATITPAAPVVVLSPSSSSTASSSHPRKYGVLHGSDHVTATHAPCSDSDSQRDASTDSQTVVGTESSSSSKVYHSGQDSFDSGIHDPCSEEEATVC